MDVRVGLKKAECWRIDAFELWCWRRLLRVPGTTRSSKSTLKEISPEYSLEGLILKLKLQYFGHLYGCESWTKESWALKNLCFWIVMLEKTLERPLDCKEIQPVHSKEHQSWVFVGRSHDSRAMTRSAWPHAWSQASLALHKSPAISSSVVPFSSSPQSLPASGSFRISQL